ncbi:MAG: hypothetical protein V4688_07470 [Pseudomonadota bacterium]
MNDLNKIVKRIDEVTAPLREVMESISKSISPAILRLNEALVPATKQFSEFAKTYQPLLTLIGVTLATAADAAQKWQTARKEDVVVMADNGWYPNWLTFFYAPETEPSSLDDLMSLHLNENWEDLTSKIIELCPNRGHILRNAFDLHRSGNYIAAIPLFLSQADGICCESLKSFLFTGNETEENIKKLIDSGGIEANFFIDIFLEPFKLKNHHNAGISKSTQAAKSKAPNRNGILHGHRKHLDYGTEVNSLKCFSLLSFIVYAVKELMIESNKSLKVDGLQPRPELER